MIINKKTKLKRKNNGDYLMNGKIETAGDLVIDLTHTLIVEGDIIVACSIKTNVPLIVLGNIYSQGSIESKFSITASGNIMSDFGISCGGSISAGGCIEVLGGINANYYISAGKSISCGKRIFAGLSIYRNENDCNKTIACSQLKSGVIGYGDLIIAEGERGKDIERIKKEINILEKELEKMRAEEFGEKSE